MKIPLPRWYDPCCICSSLVMFILSACISCVSGDVRWSVIVVASFASGFFRCVRSRYICYFEKLSKVCNKSNLPFLFLLDLCLAVCSMAVLARISDTKLVGAISCGMVASWFILYNEFVNSSCMVHTMCHVFVCLAFFRILTRAITNPRSKQIVLQQ